MDLEIGPKTNVDDLLTQHPYLLEVLVAQSPLFENLRNPVMRKEMGKMATLETVAGIGGLDVDELVGDLRDEIEKRAEGADERKEAFKAIIRDLHAGLPVEDAKERFKGIVGGVAATEIAAIEQALIDEGLPAEEIKELCDVHVEIFKEALEERDLPDVPPGHPVHTYMKENRRLESIASRVSVVLGQVARPESGTTLDGTAETTRELRELVALLGEVATHYARKENQLFPMLEAHHFTGPTQAMWSIHDDIRALVKEAQGALETQDVGTLRASLQRATKAMRDMIYKEEHILFPASLDMLTHEEWVRMKKGEADIGFAWVEPDEGWPGEVPEGLEARTEEAEPGFEEAKGFLRLDPGRLSQSQINLLLKHLPVDVTYVDENDRVAYYSEGPERIFPRSPAIIGREVRNCHPPKSVHVVNMILDAFKSGERDTAEFWLELEGRFIHIRYFAIRDAEGRYQGTLEVSQDVTGIRALEGAQRLLDWD
jgi:DUF438 domain-containing protein